MPPTLEDDLFEGVGSLAPIIEHAQPLPDHIINSTMLAIKARIRSEFVKNTIKVYSSRCTD